MKNGPLTATAQRAPAPAAPTPAAPPPEVARLLDEVGQLLAAGKPKQALDALSRDESDWARNARGVCLMRLGQAAAAVDTLRGLAVARHLSLKPEAPTLFKVNFATALLLSGNVSGGLGALVEVRDEQHPTVQKLRAAVERWKASMGFWKRLNWRMGGEIEHPFTLDFPPGDVV
jgi:hypothetical protein